MIPLPFGYIASFSAASGANTPLWILAFFPPTGKRSVLRTAREIGWREAFRARQEIEPAAAGRRLV